MAASAAPADNFDDIRPYRDDEVAEALARLTADSDLAQALLGFLWPRLRSQRWSPLRRLLTPLATALLRRRFGRADSVLSLQSLLDDYLQRLVQSTTDGFSWSGIRRLPEEPCLFISNHRDITMDPALVDLALWRSGRSTVRIAVGDNLLRNRALAELIKLNKGFVVRRRFPSRRAEVVWRRRFARYIRSSLLEDRQSVWIAQRDGRAKDGLDSTHPGLIQMLLWAGDEGLSGVELLRALRIVPVAISYEYDPCDALKAAELLELSQTGNYSKTADEDLSSVIAGCIGAKGRVHISFGRPLAPDSDDSAAVAQQIDRQILADYMLQPSNYLACEMLGKSFVAGRCSADGQPYRRAGLAAEVRHFEARIAAMAPELRDQVLTMYANPVLEQQRVLREEGASGDRLKEA